MDEPHAEVRVVDRDGWMKDYPLVKNIVQVGSDPTSDVFLDPNRGSGVALRHVQLIHWPGPRRDYRLVNLGDDEVVIVGPQGERALAPREAARIEDGESFRLGEFTLVLRCLGLPIERVTRRSEYIDAELYLPGVPLAPERTLEGVIVLRNLGEEEGVQFEIDLEGVPGECCQIDPAPLMFPGSEERVRLRISHLCSIPLAGEREVSVRVTAPGSYPGEEVVLSRTLHVLPCYRHRLYFWSPDQEVGESARSSLRESTGVTSPTAEAGGIGPTPVADTWWAAAEEASPPLRGSEVQSLRTAEEPDVESEEEEWWTEEGEGG